MTVSQSERLDAARAKIEAATKQFLASGGEIVQLGSQLSPIKSQSWMDAAKSTKAAGLSYISEQGLAPKPSKPRRSLSAAKDRARRDELLKAAINASSKAKEERRAAMAPEVRRMADTYPVTQIARELGIAAGTVRRIGRDHNITLNTSRGVMPVKESAT